MPLKKLTDEADRNETSDLLKEEYRTARHERRSKLVEACKDDFSEVFEKGNFTLSPDGNRGVIATYKELTIALQWPSLDECPRDVFFRFSILKNSAETAELIFVNLVPSGTDKAIPLDIENQADASTASELRAAISTVCNAPFSFGIVRNFHPKTSVGDQPSEQTYRTFKSALAALTAVL